MIDSKKKKLILACALLLFAGIKVAWVWRWQASVPNQQAFEHINRCAPHVAPCRFRGDSGIYFVDFVNQKQAFSVVMKDLPLATEAVSVSFEMKDMDMGFNRFDLKKQSDGSWRVDNVHLPFCVAGRHDWLLIWRVDGQHYRAEFQAPV